jgi:DNA-binding CsgD family transcriptional regulator
LPIKGRETIHEYDRKITSPMISIISTSQCIPLVLYTSQSWLTLIFIFVFFLGNIFLPVYFSYGTLLPATAMEPLQDLSFEGFCRKFEVSPRESDIVREICNGLSNKEISDKLFISLQTVKDHSHRIYIKTNVKSRVQLINLVKEEAGK